MYLFINILCSRLELAYDISPYSNNLNFFLEAKNHVQAYIYYKITETFIYMFKQSLIMIRKVQKIGNSLFVSLEKKEADFLEIKEGNHVHVLVTKMSEDGN